MSVLPSGRTLMNNLVINLYMVAAYFLQECGAMHAGYFVTVAIKPFSEKRGNYG